MLFPYVTNTHQSVALALRGSTTLTLQQRDGELHGGKQRPDALGILNNLVPA